MTGKKSDAPAGSVDEARATADLIVGHLARDGDNLVVTDAGLAAIAAHLAAVSGDARLDRLGGVVMALEWLHSESAAPLAVQGAAASLLAILLGVLERTAMTPAQQEAWERRMQTVTGKDASAGVLGGTGPRPQGTVPAGPAARFAALKQAPPSSPKR